MTPIPGKSFKGDFPLHHFYPFEAIVGDKQVTIEVSKIDRRRKLRGGRYRTRSLRHTAHHHAHSQSVRQRHHLPCFTHTGTFHQFDIDSRKCALQSGHILETL